MSYKRLTTITGWIVFAIAMIVYIMTAERTGSLWDCGEFILGAYKLQVVHPPGAPLFLIVGRLFTWIAELFSSNPSSIAFAVNLMSGMCTAFAATFVAWSTMVLARLALVGRDEEYPVNDLYAICGAGLVAGLSTAFATSIWFSAVEGEVYAMSTFFTTLTVWAMIKWYGLPDTPKNDKWIIFAIYAAGLSIGVHLLSLLTFPALGVLYYFKKYKKVTPVGLIASLAIGGMFIPIVQKVIIVGIPLLWSWFELLMVNNFGLPFHSGIFPTILVIFGLLYAGLRWAHKHNNGLVQRLLVAMSLLVISFSSLGVVIIRANANTPINMNQPSDVMRVIPYLNREQYGERPLLRGPHYEAQPVTTKKVDRYGQVGDHYEIVDQKLSYVYDNKDKILLPRISHSDTDRPARYRQWMQYLGYSKNAKPSFAFNIHYALKYQVGFMYWRYFMWNFVGRQNGEQGFEPWNPKSGHWFSGIKPIDSARLYNQDQLPETIRTNQARNNYYFLPWIFGLLGFFFHFRKRKRDVTALVVLFLFTGLGIIFYSNQPPREPRERDYVLVGSIFTFCIWIGLAVPAIYQIIKEKTKLKGILPPLIAGALVIIAPLLMGFQNFDDHNRSGHYASRDYAVNFLESCDPNAILFTYGDNDTYPLWYAQEVENVRRDVRVVNLSLIAVDWYINGLRRKINDSPAIKLSIPAEGYRGNKRNAIYNIQEEKALAPEMPLDQFLQFISVDREMNIQGQKIQSYLPSKNLYIPVNKARALQSGWVGPEDADQIVDKIPIRITGNYLTKDKLAVLDILQSNIYDRPIYFSVTCQQEKLQGLSDYTQLEGLGLKVIPIKTPSQRNFFIYGSGRVDTDKVFERVTKKWKWGRFDEEKMFVDNSYGASIQAQKMVIWRAAEQMIREGKTEKAVALTDQYFKAFPHMNFPYDGRTMPHINIYIQAKEYEKAKKHLRILAVETADWMQFFDSIDEEDLQAGFSADFQLANSTVQQLLQVVPTLGDTAFTDEINGLLEAYRFQPVQE